MAKSLREAYGEALRELGRRNNNIVVCDADLAHATMTTLFKKEFPDRFFNFGVAEANMICAAAGLAESGLVPFVSTFALFGAGRGYEMIRNSVCYTGANVKFGFSHSGLSVGEDGGSHQSIEDIALIRVLPNMTIFVPCDPLETEKAVNAAASLDGPVYVRVARPICENITDKDTPFVPGKSNVIVQGDDVCIVTAGLMTEPSLQAADTLKKEGILATVINMHTIKPLDCDMILNMADKHKAMVTVEEHSIIGGLGSAVAEVIAGNSNIKFERMGIKDMFGRSGKPQALFERYGLTSEDIVRTCKHLLNRR